MPIFHFNALLLYVKVKISLEIYWTKVPTAKAIATETNIAIIIVNALLVFMSSPALMAESPKVFINAIATVPPRSSNTMETVVDVGSPSVLKMSSRTMSEAITAR